MITVRRMDLPFSAEIPKYWFNGSVLGTSMSNALNMIFPLGERFFVRSVRHYVDEIKGDERLYKEVKAFFGQEGNHSREHERFLEIMRGHGYDVDAFLRIYQKVAFDTIEPLFSPVLHLSVTVALEHFTAMFAENGLSKGEVDRVHPVMRDLLKWHAAEELEHKAVAFDVLQKVDPRYGVRILGLVMATACFVGFWILGTGMLLRQDGRSYREMAGLVYQGWREGGVANGDMRRAFVRYLARDFHPNQVDNRALAERYLDEVLGARAVA